MSQEKVDRYKEEKANRKKNIAREKRNRMITYVILVVVVILIAAWIVYSAVNSITRSQAAKRTPVNLDAVSNYLMELSNSSEDGTESDEDADDASEDSEEPQAPTEDGEDADAPADDGTDPNAVDSANTP